MLSLAEIQSATSAVYQVAQHTPLLFSDRLTERFGGAIYLKAECLQYTGSFKIRGAAAKLASMTAAERKRGVIAASAGNHAQGVAVAARRLGVEATVVMPVHAALAKVQSTRHYGANVILYGNDFDDAFAQAQSLAAQRGLVLISAFDDAQIMAGQGSVGLEIVADCDDVETVVVPVGGGGLIAGIATAVKALKPAVRLIGVQAAAAPAAAVSFQGHRRTGRHPSPTIADGVAIGAPGRLTLPLIRRYVDEIVTVDEESIAQAIVLLLEDAKLVVEGAGALGIAALLAGSLKPGSGKTAIVLSGGNIDINMLAAIVQHGLLRENRYLTLHVVFDDRPGSLASLLAIVAATGANVLEVDHIRQGAALPLRGVEVRLLLETRDIEHIDDLTERVVQAGYVLTEATETTRSFRPVSWR